MYRITISFGSNEIFDLELQILVTFCSLLFIDTGVEDRLERFGDNL